MSDSPPPTGKPLTQAAPPPPNPLPTTWREEVADWQPVSIPAPLLAASAAAVVLTSLAVNRLVAATLTMALAVWLLCLTVGLFKSSTRTTWVLSAGASLLALFLVLRDDGLLTALNVTAIVLLILTAASGDSWKTLFDIGLWYPFRRLGNLTEAYFSGLFKTTVDLAARNGGRFGFGPAEGPGDSTDDPPEAPPSNSGAPGRNQSVFIGLALAVPVLLIFGALLAQADPVFASLFTNPFTIDADLVDSVFGHLAAAVFTASVIIALAVFRSRQASTDPAEISVTMPAVTAMVLLGLINLLFAVFALVQLWTLGGGARHVIESQGLTFAQYARQGFFQLLWVAGLMFVLMTTVRLILGAVETRRRFQVQFILAGVLTLAIVAVAVGRLSLYIGAFGLTILRFYTTVFSIWIALAFLLLMASEFVFTDRRWLTGAIAATAFVFLVGVNLAAPSALIVRDQLNGTDAVDLHTLPSNGDAVAATASWIIDATGNERNFGRAKAQLCANDLLNRTGTVQPLASGSGLDFNLSRRQADRRRDQVCS